MYGNPEYTPLDEKHRLQVPSPHCQPDTLLYLGVAQRTLQQDDNG